MLYSSEQTININNVWWIIVCFYSNVTKIKLYLNFKQIFVFKEYPTLGTNLEEQKISTSIYISKFLSFKFK